MSLWHQGDAPQGLPARAAGRGRVTDPHGPGARRDDACADGHERRLARAVHPEQRRHARADVEVDVRQRRGASVAVRHPADDEARHVRRLSFEQGSFAGVERHVETT
ncbi:hypothetical protein GCM10025868_29020 [Angustibacter aerolatus]|uniref:Uncharacterized protein n=1 Tax=Angustibacter aerolatus TaxID=1162965 RepID=A0ABQ6JIS5_9ACTN|nr:hypothetical protein GCM10025868_29020 [Angustibacter aerolatus]